MNDGIPGPFGFVLKVKPKGKSSVWVAHKRWAGKWHTIYIGQDRAKAKEVITEWAKKKGIEL